MGVNSLAKTATRQRRGCDLNPGPSAPESSALTTRLPSHSKRMYSIGNPAGSIVIGARYHLSGGGNIDRCVGADVWM